MTRKPIAVIWFPSEFAVGNEGELLKPLELMAEFNGWTGTTKPNDDISQYLWFCFSNPDIITPEIKVFLDKDLTEIELEELKQMVLKEVNKKPILNDFDD